MFKNKLLTSTILAAAIALTGALGFAGAANAAKVKVGFSNEAYPPFTSTDSSGKWVGWEIEIGQAICTEAKLDCELAPVAWDGIIESLKTKKIDLIIGSMNSTPERAEQIDFSDKYYENSAFIVAPKKAKFTSKTADLAGKTIGVQISTTFSAYAEVHYKAKSKLKIYQTQDEELQDLIAGRIDAVVSDAVSLGDWLKGAGKDCCEFKGQVEPDKATLGTGIAIGVRKGEMDMMTKINAAIKAIRANGTYKKISDKYKFGFDIYGS